VFSGDFIFVGDVGRPDLLERAANVAGTMRTAAAELFDSIQGLLARYPDFVQIWPGHGSGSACGKSLGAVPSSTVGYERIANWGLRERDRAAFVETVLAGQPDPPPYFAVMKRLNRDGPTVLGRAPASPRLAASQLPAALARGARVIDIRPATAFAAGHVRGTISIPLVRSFLTWAGWLVSHDNDFYLLHDGADDSTAREALNELAMIGLDRCAGWFGADTLADAVIPLPQVEPAALPPSRATLQVVDVRSLEDFVVGHIPGASHIPLGRLEARLGELDLSRPIVVNCQGGSRSAIAASLLEVHGAQQVTNLAGGFSGWTNAGLPVETGEDRGT
jgi:hydroxyacylglutathione hydrolase